MDENDEEVCNVENSSPEVGLIPLGWTRVSIVEIMESWPLQLKLSDGEEEFFVELALDAVIESRSGTSSVRELHPKQQIDVLIESDSRQPEGHQVSHIKIP